MARLSLCLLGGLQITLNGHPLAGLAYTKAQALLAYLVVESGRPHYRDALGSLLWPELSSASARANLRLVLANLREALGDTAATAPFLQITRDTIAFNRASDHELDVGIFGALLAACAHHPHRTLDRCLACVARLEQATARYAGEFLDEFAPDGSDPFNEWALAWRQRLHQQAMDALHALSNFYLYCGQDERALVFLRRQIELEPWQEEAHQELMRLYVRTGQRSNALAQYHRCRQALNQEFQLAPLPETTALYEQIQRGVISHDDRSSRQAHPSTLLPAPAPPLVGRNAELARLSDLLCNPACRIVTLVGPGGIGKTRLALAAAAAHAPLFTDGAAFVSLAGVSPDASIASAMADALGISRYGADDPRSQILTYLCGKELLLVIDNAEHMLESMAFLAELAAATPPLVLLVTSRARLQLCGEWVIEVQGLSYPSGAGTVGRHGYDSVELFEQTAERARGAPLPATERPWVEEICRFVEGMPLAIELAATWTRTLTCEEIAGKMAGNSMFLTAPLRAEAWRYFHEALAVAREASLTSVALDVLIGVATIMRDEGEDDSARELLTLVLHHSASRAETSSQARELLDSSDRLPSSSPSDASFEDEGGRFDAIIEQILNAPMHLRAAARSVTA